MVILSNNSTRENQPPTSAFIDSKKHLLILDALRGIAAIMVVTMHTFELFSEGNYQYLWLLPY